MIDRADIWVKAGNGGAGRISFHREKYVPFGGPDGGDGGRGGDVLVRADAGMTMLQAFKYEKRFRADDGGDGQTNRKHGKSGKDRVVTVPEGTVVWEKTAEGNVLVADLEQAGQEVVVAHGGRGGWGNVHFASSTNQTPYVAQVGEVGEERDIVLELRLIAEVGIVGYPNAGKSTLLSRVSSARPKIAAYPFTTLEPVLGVVEVDGQRFVIAEIPGLVPGAHLGKGLGHDFLRHVTRTKAIIHLVDGSSASPISDMIAVNNELALFDHDLGRKPQIVAVNKIDLPQVRERREEIARDFAAAGIHPWFISASTSEGVPDLTAAAARLVRAVPTRTAETGEGPLKVFRPAPVDRRGTAVRKEGEVFVVAAPDLERLVTRRGEKYRTDLERQLRREMARRGIARALERAGIRPGDRVRCGTTELEW